MDIIITDVTCPICGSIEVRSKVGHEDGTWSYICDNWNHPHEILLNGEVVSLRDKGLELKERMFYFHPESDTIQVPFMNGNLRYDGEKEVKR